MAMGRIRNARGRRGAARWLRGQLSRRPRPLWMMYLCHVLALGIALVLYALPHHVIPHGETAIGVSSSRRGPAATEAPADIGPETETADEEPAETVLEEVPVEEEESSEDVVAPEAEPATVVEDEAALAAMFGVDAVGSFAETFADQFTDGGVERSDNSYRSANVSVNISQRYVEDLDAQVYVADIYVADISCLITAFSQDKYGWGYTEWITDVAKRYKSVVTMNGDYYGSRSMGIIIRNGELYRDKKYTGDVCILYWDGHMETFRGTKCNARNEIDRGAYQSWSFGPSLLDSDGKPLKDFNCDNYLRNRHPRSAIGYYEPGHYCFVTVDGRSDDSHGATLTQMATMLSRMGCKQGYNLDGGQTSLMAAGTTMLNHPSQGGRDSSDYIMVVDRITQ